jgi:hypothetical protein
MGNQGKPWWPGIDCYRLFLNSELNLVHDFGIPLLRQLPLIHDSDLSNRFLLGLAGFV